MMCYLILRQIEPCLTFNSPSLRFSLCIAHCLPYFPLSNPNHKPKETRMRLILIGTEYAGKTTLSQALQQWGQDRNIRHHMDDHFTIPDCQMLKTKEDQEIMRGLPQVIKERYQRFQLAYHVRLLHKYEHIILAGFHIEETVYGPRYYYPDIGRVAETPAAWEAQMPPDTILILLTARPDVIEKRMADTPHEYAVVPKDEVQDVQREFQEEFRKSILKKKFQIDTSDLTLEGLLDAFFDASIQHITVKDHLIRN